MKVIKILTLAFLALYKTAYAECMYEKWIIYVGDELFISSDSEYYSFQTDYVAIDADGAPNAYHPNNIGLDYLANAGYPNTTWWSSVIVEDPEDPSVGFIQPDGEFAGYFVSKTALIDRKIEEIDVVKHFGTPQLSTFL